MRFFLLFGLLISLTAQPMHDSRSLVPSSADNYHMIRRYAQLSERLDSARRSIGENVGLALASGLGVIALEYTYPRLLIDSARAFLADQCPVSAPLIVLLEIGLVGAGGKALLEAGLEYVFRYQFDRQEHDEIIGKFLKEQKRK